jgi:ligand-binding sensor domain-containing protein
MNRFVILCLLLTISCINFAQEEKHYDIIDGLSSIEVTDIAENENFIWIATCDGLNRFDGKSFKIFKRENGLTENNIETLFFDSEGFLWIGLKTGGVDIYDPKKETFTPLNHFISEKVPSRVITIMEDSRKNIWLGTWEEGLYKLTPIKKPGTANAGTPPKFITPVTLYRTY